MYALLAFHEAHKMKPLSSPYAGLSTLRYPAGWESPFLPLRQVLAPAGLLLGSASVHAPSLPASVLPEGPSPVGSA